VYWKAYLNKFLIHSDRLDAVDRHYFNEKNEIAEIETDKKIKKEIGDEFFEI
jgi:hypothetical protein